MAEQYLHGGQEGEAQVVPGLSGPATVEKRTLEGGYPWTRLEKKNVPSQGQGRLHHVRQGPPRSTWALEACTGRRSHRSELSHYAADFGVSLGKDNWGLPRSERFP